MSAMSPKPHSYRWLHKEIVPRARSWPTSSEAAGDREGLKRSPAGDGHPRLPEQPALPLAEGTTQMSIQYHEPTPLRRRDDRRFDCATSEN